MKTRQWMLTTSLLFILFNSLFSQVILQQDKNINTTINAKPVFKPLSIEQPWNAKPVFLHTATSSNIYGKTKYMTILDHWSTNNKPDAVLFVTERSQGNFHNNPIAVYYLKSRAKWVIYHENGEAIQEGATYNVLALKRSESVITHTTSSSNIYSGYHTIIDLPIGFSTDFNLANFTNFAMLVTKVTKARTKEGDYSPIGIWCHPRSGKWMIYNQDKKPMSEGVGFNVTFFASGEKPHEQLLDAKVFKEVKRESYPDYGAYIPDLLGEHAFVFATYNFSQKGGAGHYNPHELAVRYVPSKPTKKRWEIINKDQAKLPAIRGVDNYHILAIGSAEQQGQCQCFQHTTNAANIKTNRTLLENSATNNHPEALVFVERIDKHYSDPQKQIGVSYDRISKKWLIYQEDETQIPLGNVYQVCVTKPSRTAFDFTTSRSNIKASRNNHSVVIDHPNCNNNPTAKIKVTQKWKNVKTIQPRVPHTNFYKVFYDTNLQQWVISNTNYAPMPEGVVFNVVVE